MNENEMVNNIRNGGKIISNLFEELKNFIKPDVSDYEIDSYCKEYFNKNNVVSGALGYHGFPNYVCISINNTVCHGTTRGIIIKNGDVVSVDVVIKINNYFSDSCFTFPVGEVSIRHQKVVNAAYESMWQTIYLIKDGIRVGDLGYSMEKVAKKFGFNVIKEFCGHGIGEAMHQEPMIPFFGLKGTGKKLKTGDIITIEPMVVEKSNKIKILEDDWTAITLDNGYSAQFEHTVLVKENGFEVLTYNDFDFKNNKNKIVN